jgi:hypothetical protein
MPYSFTNSVNFTRLSSRRRVAHRHIEWLLGKVETIEEFVWGPEAMMIWGNDIRERSFVGLVM